MKQNLSIQQKQQAVFSQQMQRALALLQLPVMELSTLIAKELEENPVLEYSDDNNFEGFELNFKKTIVKKEDEDLKAFLENSISYENSLFDHLMQQARDIFSDPVDLKIAEEVIGNFDESGFLTTSIEEISLLSEFAPEKIEEILHQIKQFDPPGVGAKNLQESLLIQLEREGKGAGLAYKVIEHHFDEIIHNRIPQIAKKMHIKDSSVLTAIEKEIMRLDFHPGTSFPRGHYAEENATINPDLIISKEGLIEINDKYIPSFRINPYYLQMLANESMAKETKEYIHSKIASGKWLLRNLDERNHTLYRIAEILVEKEKDFLTEPSGKLTPLTMKETAERLSLNESTVARAVANKYVGCLRGIVPLRSFFTYGMTTEDGSCVSVNTVKECLTLIIKEENRNKPLSDLALSKKLKEKGFTVARRTVAKYRMELGIGTVSQRKSFIS